MSCYALDFNKTDPENKQICLQITRQNIGLKGVMIVSVWNHSSGGGH